jgi:hypothetical protein
MVLFVSGLGCSNTPCDEVARTLRECCKEGPVELENACEERAAGLEDRGNEEACDAALERGDFAECGT